MNQKSLPPSPLDGRPFNRRAPSRHRGGVIIGIFIGLVIGVLIAFGVVWYLKKAPLPFLDKTFHAEKPDARPGGEEQGPLPLPGKPGDKVSEKPRFEFYKILPGGDATQTDKVPAQGVPPQTAAPAAPTESFYLQAGAFQKSAEADNFKAKLAMMGLETDVQEVTLPDKGVIQRVRVGPFSTPEEMNRARNQLALNGIQATVVKVSHP